MKNEKIKYILILLVCFIVILPSKNSYSVLPAAAVISGAVLGAMLLAGASMSPQQTSDYYAATSGAADSVVSTGGNMFRGVYQAQQMFNALGLGYMVGREAMLKQDIKDFYGNAKSLSGSLSQAFNDLIDSVTGYEAPPVLGIGDIYENGGSYYQITNVTHGTGYNVTTDIETCYASIPANTMYDTYFKFFYFVQYVGTRCDYGYTRYYHIPYILPEGDPLPVNFPPPPVPDLTPFKDGLKNTLDDTHVDYNPMIQEDIDKILKGSPPATVTPVEAGTGDNDSAPPVPDIVEIPGVIPQPVPIPDAPVEPDPLVDNDLLQGIYNNTLATAKNTNIIAGKDAGTLDDSGIINAINDITFDNSIVEQNTADIRDSNIEIRDLTQDIKDKLYVEQPDIDGFLTDFDSQVNSKWAVANDDMNTELLEAVNGLDPVPPSMIADVKAFFVNLLPSSQECIPLDLSYNEHELIIGCEGSDIAKTVLTYFFYITTILGIYTMVHRELRPNA